MVVITGSRSGIGRACAESFARAGDTVVATVRDPITAAPLRDALADTGARTEVRALDVTDDAQVAAALDAVLDAHGRVDVLVANAAISVEATLEDLPIDELRRVLDVNVLGAARAMKAVLPAMRQAGAGRIIAVSSMGGVLGQPFNDAYCASKFALEGLCASVAPVAAAHGVRVTLVEPGPVQGEFLDKTPSIIAEHHAAAYARFVAVRRAAYAVAPRTRRHRRRDRRGRGRPRPTAALPDRRRRHPDRRPRDQGRRREPDPRAHLGLAALRSR